MRKPRKNAFYINIQEYWRQIARLMMDYFTIRFNNLPNLIIFFIYKWFNDSRAII